VDSVKASWWTGARVGYPVFFALIFLTSAAAAQDSCLKRVFGRYCLGGDINVLLRQAPQSMAQQVDGERHALIYPKGGDDLYVMAFRNRIYKVLLRYGTASQLRYEDLYRLLRKKYGLGRDESRFPQNANTPARRLVAIRRGEGRAIHIWRPAKTWHIELSWTREMGLALAYMDSATDAQQQAERDGGY